MAVRVEFDEKLSGRAGGAAGVDISATTVQAVLLQVGKAYPAFHMFNCEGELRGTFRLQKNGQPVAVQDSLQDGDTLHLGVG